MRSRCAHAQASHGLVHVRSPARRQPRHGVGFDHGGRTTPMGRTGRFYRARGARGAELPSSSRDSKRTATRAPAPRRAHRLSRHDATPPSPGSIRRFAIPRFYAAEATPASSVHSDHCQAQWMSGSDEAPRE